MLDSSKKKKSNDKTSFVPILHKQLDSIWSIGISKVLLIINGFWQYWEN